jgi:tRNA G10  N-methylase Trm11
MDSFEAKSLSILGRQPALGLAELESLYGQEHVKPLDNAALLDIPAEEINFRKLGGTIKVARVLAELSDNSWSSLSKYLIKTIPDHLQYLPGGKFTFGLSVYGLSVRAEEINRLGLEIKKLIKNTGRLTHKGAWELIFIKTGSKTILAQTLFVQDIEAYAARDQTRPARDSRVGMLPPKLAQIIINLAVGSPQVKNKNWDSGDGLGTYIVLDPFCGTGVILQEALLANYSVYGTDIDPRMVEYSKQNLQWLIKNHPSIEGKVTIEQADATTYQWPGFSVIASEVYLGRPLGSFPPEDKFKEIVFDTNTIIKKFLKNLESQLKPGRRLVLAVPAWRKPDGQLVKLPLIDQLTDMGYNYSDLKHVKREDLVYFREEQIVARRLLRIEKK